jgi:hypothetical protein
MKLTKETLGVLQAFAGINTNLVIRVGSKISTVSSNKTIMAEYDSPEKFDKQVSIFNLNELLGVIGAFDDPELELDEKYLTVKEGKQKVKYVYADEALLTAPTKSITMPNPEVKFGLTADSLGKIQKMAGILAVEDVAFVGDGTKIVAQVYDSKNPTGNNFEIDLGMKTKETFNVQIKVDRLKLIPGDYLVEISSKKISKFTTTKLVVYIAVEATSTFN